MNKAGPGKITFHALRNLFKKPSTTDYIGKGAPEVEAKYRGRIKFSPENCVNCGLCMRDCPTGALKIINEGTKEDKKMKAILDVSSCIFCGQCVDSCNKKCLSSSQDIDFARTNKDDLKEEI